MKTIMLKLNLVVIRAINPPETAKWYAETFDLQFVDEKHNDGVLHYSAKLSGALLEIYPVVKERTKITFGFAVSKTDFETITKRTNHKIIDENLVLIKDPDGNSIIFSLSE